MNMKYYFCPEQNGMTWGGREKNRIMVGCTSPNILKKNMDEMGNNDNFPLEVLISEEQILDSSGGKNVTNT